MSRSAIPEPWTGLHGVVCQAVSVFGGRIDTALNHLKVCNCGIKLIPGVEQLPPWCSSRTFHPSPWKETPHLLAATHLSLPSPCSRLCFQAGGLAASGPPA